MNFGRVGFVMEGDWSAAVTYDTLSVVLYEGAVYAAKRMSAGSEPSTHPADWLMWVESPVVSAEQTENGYDLTITNGDGTTSVVHLLNGQITEAELTTALSGLREAFNANIAEGYSSSSVYSEGDYCLYNNVLYRCKTDILTPEAWDSDHWEAASLADDVQDLSENLYNNKVDAITSNASGEIVTISDGGKDLPVVDLKVSLLPVQSGSGDPSPSNIRPISGWTGVNVRATGKNLLDISLLTYFTWDASEGAYKIDPATSFSIRKTAVPFKDNTQYVITATVRATQSGTKWGLFVEYTDSTRSEWARTTTSYQTLTIITDANKTISRIGRQRGADSGSVYIKDWIIAESSVAVPYEPFGQVIPIDWSSSVGTVYRAVVDVTKGTVESWRGFVEFSGDDGWTTGTVSSKTVFQIRRPNQVPNGAWFLSNYITSTDSLSGSGKDNKGYFGSTYFNVYCPSVPDLATWKAMLNTTPMQINFTLSSHPVYQIDPNQISTFLGQNNFWTNTDGQIDLEYRADTKLYIEQLTKPSEDDMVANANIASGRFFMVGNRLMLSTTAIAQGEQIVVGTNCSEVSLADALNQINS